MRQVETPEDPGESWRKPWGQFGSGLDPSWDQGGIRREVKVRIVVPLEEENSSEEDVQTQRAFVVVVGVPVVMLGEIKVPFRPGNSPPQARGRVVEYLAWNPRWAMELSEPK